MTAAHTPDGAKWTYGYDAFARRLWKQEWKRGAAPGEVTTIGWQTGARHDFVWDGDVVARETTTEGGTTRQISWVYEPGSFVPIARLEEGRLSYVVTDHLGTPRELVSETGMVEWAADYRSWGRVRRLWSHRVAAGAMLAEAEGNLALDRTTLAALADCPIRFQGQWEDSETGLYYNRFRYYEPLSAAYIVGDPLGLVGGMRPYGYAGSPAIMLDPLGLYGVYVFRVLPGARRNVGNCYVGRGDPGRFAQSRKERSGFTDRRCAEQHTRGRHYNTDVAAAAAGASPLEFGKLVEHQLIGGYNAVGRPDWANAQLDGQSAWARANPTQRASAMAEANRIRALALVDSGCT